MGGLYTPFSGSIYVFSDWIDLHAFDAKIIRQVISERSIGKQMNLRRINCRDKLNLSIFDRDNCYKNIIVPALNGFLTIGTDLSSVVFGEFSDEEPRVPYTVKTEAGPVVMMDWKSRLEDLILLAHEAGHALQLLNCPETSVPPVKREIAAFLAELLVIDHISKSDTALAVALAQVWRSENSAYLGDDLIAMRRAIDNPMTPYYYRHNYPLARIVAMRIFRDGDSLAHRSVFDGRLDLPKLVASLSDSASIGPKLVSRKPEDLWATVVDIFCQTYPEQEAELRIHARNLIAALEPDRLFEELQVVSRYDLPPILRCAYRTESSGMRAMAAGFGETLAVANKPGLVAAPLSAALGLATVAPGETCDAKITKCSTGLTKSARFEVMAGHVESGWIDLKTQVLRTAPTDSARPWKNWRSLGALALSALSRGEADVRPDTFLDFWGESTHRETAAEQDASNFDALVALGMAIEHLRASPYHRRFSLSHYLPVEIIPALWSDQMLTVLGPRGRPAGLVTWAWISEEVEVELHATGRALGISEWRCGPRLFFNDWIVKPEFMKLVIAHMTGTVFPDHQVATSIRRNADSSVRRINRWTNTGMRRDAPVLTHPRSAVTCGGSERPTTCVYSDLPNGASICGFAHGRQRTAVIKTTVQKETT